MISTIRRAQLLASRDESHFILPGCPLRASVRGFEELIMRSIRQAKIVSFAPGLSEVV